MKNKILEELKVNEGRPVSGEEMSRRLGISRTAVWKHIQKLRSEGYNVESQTNSGYKLAGSPDILTQEELEPLLDTSFIGRKIIYLESVDSTNSYGKKVAEGSFVEGTVIFAEEQSSGRGRLGRYWVSPKGKGIWMSLLLKPEVLPSDAPKLTIVAAQAVANALLHSCGLSAQIKWPNDIVAGGRKLCGILTEMSAEEDEIRYVIVGIGINANLEPVDFGAELLETATSVNIEKGGRISRKVLSAAVLMEFERLYTEFARTGSIASFLDDYKSRSAVLGKDIRIIGKKEEIIGTAVDISEEGQLVVRLEDGSLREVMSGEVSVRSLNGYI